MKKILIMRHAKSDWNNIFPDFDRPLNKRGKKAAIFMGKEIKKRVLTPDIIISSPAKRAKQTSESIADKCNYNKKIIFEDNFYFGYMKDIVDTLIKLSDNYNSVMIFGHNPTMESLVEFLSDKYVVMPTAAISVLNFDAKSWKTLKKSSCKLVLHLKPRDMM